MKVADFIFILAAVGGCVSGSDLQTRLASWVGTDADRLAKSWGAPYGDFKTKSGDRILSYERSSVQSFGPTSYQRTTSRFCQVNFTVGDDNRIVGANWSGDLDECDRYINPSAHYIEPPVSPSPQPSPAEGGAAEP